MNCLNYFAIWFGQKVNHAKSNIFFSRNVKLNTQLEILDKYDFCNTIDLGMYLGILIIHKRVNRNTYSHLNKKEKEKV